MQRVGEREERSIGRGKTGVERAKREPKGWSLVSSCLHKAAPHQIAFVLNIWIEGCGWWRRRRQRAMPPEKREREKDQIRRENTDTSLECVSYAKTGPHFYRQPSQTKRGRTTPLYDTQLVSSVFPSFGSQYSPRPLRPADSSDTAERVSSPTPGLLSNLPAARYRLPNKLTGAEHSVTSGIPVLVSFQNHFQSSDAILL